MTQQPEHDRELVEALRRLSNGPPVPSIAPEREAALLAAFEAYHARRGARSVRGGWWLSALAVAAVLLIALGTAPGWIGRHGTPPPVPPSDAHAGADHRGAQADIAPGDFIPWPGASALPPLESGQLVRMDLPVTLLPSLGVTPPAAPVTAVKADVIIGQDGLARAVRFVGN